MNATTYSFLAVVNCNMCGSPTNEARVLGMRMNRSQGMRPTRLTGVSTKVMKCRNCDLVFSNPLPVPSTLAQHYGVPPENYWTPAYFVLEDDHFAKQIKRYLALSGATSGAGQRSLDIGAGIGKCIKAMERAGFDSFGIEPSEPFYDRAINRLGLSREQLNFSAMEDASYPKGNFDFITFGAVLEHLYDPAESVSKALEWTKPGGLIHIEVPSSKWLTNKIANMVYALQGLDYVSNISPMHSPFHLYEFGLRSFEANASQRGYEIAHYEYMVCSTYLPRALDFIVRPLMAATDTGMQLEIWLRKSSAD